MDDIIARIEGYVTDIYPDILDDLSMTEDQLTFLVNSVVDRALIFMNRDQLVAQYEDDLEDYDPDDSSNDDFWEAYEANYGYPIPARVERILADVVVAVSKNVINRNTADVGAIKSISDQGQSITYADQVSNFLNSSDESEVFSGSLELLRKYILPTIPDNADTDQL